MPPTPDPHQGALLDIVDKLQQLAGQVETFPGYIPPSLAEFARAWHPGAIKPLRVRVALGERPAPLPVDHAALRRQRRDQEAYERRVAAEAAELAAKEARYQVRPEMVGK
jgi:hypothetical protein